MINTTFDMDFSIADRFGESAVRDTYRRAFDEWKNNVEYLTALVIALNHKLWQHYVRKSPLTEVYRELYEQADAWCMENLEGENMRYFLTETD